MAENLPLSPEGTDDDPIIATNTRDVIARPTEEALFRRRHAELPAPYTGGVPDQRQAKKLQNNDVLIKLLFNLSDKDEANIIGPFGTIKEYISGSPIGSIFSEGTFTDAVAFRSDLRNIRLALQDTLKLKTRPSVFELETIAANLPDESAIFGNQSDAIHIYAQYAQQFKRSITDELNFIDSIGDPGKADVLKSKRKILGYRAFIKRMGPIVEDQEDFDELPLGTHYYDFVRKALRFKARDMTDEEKDAIGRGRRKPINRPEQE